MGGRRNTSSFGNRQGAGGVRDRGDQELRGVQGRGRQRGDRGYRQAVRAVGVEEPKHDVRHEPEDRGARACGSDAELSCRGDNRRRIYTRRFIGAYKGRYGETVRNEYRDQGLPADDGGVRDRDTADTCNTGMG